MFLFFGHLPRPLPPSAHPLALAAYFVIYNVNFFDFCQVRAHLINGNKTQQRQQKAAEMSSKQGEGGSTKRVEVEGQREWEEEGEAV